MWNQVQRLLQPEPAAADKSAPAVVPLRRSALALSDLRIGSTVRFAIDCPLPPFTGRRCTVTAIRQYKFGDDAVKSFVLDAGDGCAYALTVAEDNQGHYLGLSRPLDMGEQDHWFGRDALSFFTEPSSAKTIRCKADLMIESAWAAARYSKSVDWVEGTVNDGGRNNRAVHYNLLVDDSGEKALEIEHDDEGGANRVFVTVYRPVSDIGAIESGKLNGHAEAPRSEPAIAAPQPKARPDFRRISEEEGEEIHIARTVRPESAETEEAGDIAELPSFLINQSSNYLSLDEVIPPEGERVRVGLVAARTLIDRALAKNVRVRDVLREMIGLESALSEEVTFELPLSDTDYRTLAMRYKLRPDHRDEIRARLQEELRRQLIG